jgi:hypothetical protein
MLKPLALALLALLFAAPASAQLAFGLTTHDFGEIEEGVEARHTFVFENEGDRPLTLRAVRPSCGCTTPSFTTEPVGPGERGQIVVAYDSEGRPGPFRRSIRVTADAGGDAVEETLYITGTVQQEALAAGVPQGNVLFDTDAHDVGTVAADREVSRVFKMQHTGRRPIRVTGVKSFPEGLHVVAPTAPVFAGDLVDIRVTVPAGAADGPFDYGVVLTTDDEAQPTKSLRLTGVMTPAPTQ